MTNKPQALVHNPRTMGSIDSKPGSANAAVGARVGLKRLSWRAHLMRGAVFVALLCLGIAGLLATMKGGGFGRNLIYSLAIGVCCWFIIDAGRLAAAFSLDRCRAARGQAPLPHTGFPGWPWMVSLSLLGMVLGPLAGTAIADLITGKPTPSLLQLG